MDIKDKIKILANEYASKLDSKIVARVEEMKNDNNTHYLIYQVLWISENEWNLIDIYQNKWRFLYKYAWSFLEEATILCFEDKFKEAQRKVYIPNNSWKRPKRFEIDCLVWNRAYEIKRRDATTDWDHITKEHTRALNIKESWYVPIRIMFYYPLRKQSLKIQETIKTVYDGLGGECYFWDDARDFLNGETNIDLKWILESIAKENLST